MAPKFKKSILKTSEIINGRVVKQTKMSHWLKKIPNKINFKPWKGLSNRAPQWKEAIYYMKQRWSETKLGEIIHKKKWKYDEEGVEVICELDKVEEHFAEEIFDAVSDQEFIDCWNCDYGIFTPTEIFGIHIEISADNEGFLQKPK